MVVVVGISFNLIIIRVDQTIAFKDGTSYVAGAESANPTSYPLRFIRSSVATGSGGVEVIIHRDVDRMLDVASSKHEADYGKPDEQGEWTAV
jgi:hypothetical protein